MGLQNGTAFTQTRLWNLSGAVSLWTELPLSAMVSSTEGSEGTRVEPKLTLLGTLNRPTI
jgi:hypothetical protein